MRSNNLLAKDHMFSGKTRSRDGTLSRHSGIKMSDLNLTEKIASTPYGETWKGVWQGNEIVAKYLKLGGEGSDHRQDILRRASRMFSEEFPRLRIFSHPNVLPVIGCTNAPPNLIIVNQWMPYGSLYHILHESRKLSVDGAMVLKFAIEVARGMAFLHSLDPLIPRLFLNSKHVMVDEEMTARINMADAKFSFQERHKFFNPAWMAPETLTKKSGEFNERAADMWSFGVLLWEMNTRQVPFGELSPMELGMKIALEDLRLSLPPNLGTHMMRIVRICMNEEPGKRPSFDQLIPILDKMKES